MKPGARVVDPDTVARAGCSGEWRWRDPGERIAAGDRTDHGTATRWHTITHGEAGRVLRGDEAWEVMTPVRRPRREHH